MDRLIVLCFVALLAGVVLAEAADAAVLTGRAEVVDGDGLLVGKTVVRLHGVDAPEIGQVCSSASGGSWDCGGAARVALAALLEGASVSCRRLDRDRYGRIIAQCSVAGDVAGALVDRGLAWAFVRYSDDYVAREAAAQAAGVGVWQAKTQTAWDYRAARWKGAATTSPADGCPIKGNIDAQGERIYHTPWSPFYGRTQINVANGERWFCNEAEAQEAGWRAARF